MPGEAVRVDPTLGDPAIVGGPTSAIEVGGCPPPPPPPPGFGGFSGQYALPSPVSAVRASARFRCWACFPFQSSRMWTFTPNGSSFPALQKATFIVAVAPGARVPIEQEAAIGSQLALPHDPSGELALPNHSE